jgi:hypothetical protein
MNWIRFARLWWAGHTVRMRESGPASKSTLDLLLGERTVGRPKRRGTEDVEREMKGMGGKDWAVEPRRELHVDPILLFHTDRQEEYHCSLETGIIFSYNILTPKS